MPEKDVDAGINKPGMTTVIGWPEFKNAEAA
jgi:hypothetical protein